MFKPTISNSSRKMAARGTKDVMERLYWTKEKLEEQKAKKAKESAKHELDGCTFIPKISKSAATQKRTNNVPIHERLFPAKKQQQEREAKEAAAKAEAQARAKVIARRSPSRSPTKKQAAETSPPAKNGTTEAKAPAPAPASATPEAAVEADCDADV